MWDVVTDGAHAFQYVCSTVEMNHMTLHQYVKPSLFAVVGSGVWLWDRIKRRRQGAITDALKSRIQNPTSTMRPQID